MFGFLKQKSAKSYAKSTAAFLFLPQFRLMTPFYKELRTTFIQILAITFAEAGLLRKNHPATQMHSHTAKTTHVLGEAWATLRSGQGHVGPYQWAIFISIIMMLTLVLTTLILAVCRITYMFTSVASAQLFNHPSGNDTTFDTVPAATPAGTAFDKGAAVQGGGDLAIDLLNKVLRQGASGVAGVGGPLQNAFSELIEVYNTGILVIASFIVFWMLFSFVFSTVSTGFIGGGRRSSVWVPIRFIMAMGLLMPLTSGYNAGQFIVMKLAEMGSNLGSQGWYAYVADAASQSLIAPFEMADPTELAVAQGRIYTCAAAVNTYISTFPGNMPTLVDMHNSREFVRPYIKANVGVPAAVSPGLVPPAPGGFAATDIPNKTPGTPLTYLEYLFGNQISDSYCGGLTIPNEFDPYVSGLAPGDPIAQMKRVMRNAYIQAFAAQAPTAHNLGCGIIRHTFPDDYLRVLGDSAQAYGHYCSAGQLTACNFSAFGDPASDAPIDCIQTMINGYAAAIYNAYSTTALPLLQTYITDTGAGGFVERARNMGWAGMGVWYHQIVRMNESVQEISDNNIGFISPDYGGWYRLNRLKSKTKEAVEFYDEWWENSPAPQTPPEILRMVNHDGSTRSTGSKGKAKVVGLDAKKSIATLRNEGTSSQKKMNTLVNLFYPADGWFLHNLGHYSDVYPLAALQKLGSDLLVYAAISYGVSFAIGFVAGAELEGKLPIKIKGKKVKGKIDLGDLFLSLLAGPIGNILDMITGIFIIGGLFLTYILPIIPWMRVTFAVMGWIMAVFEAVVMVPILALSHLKTGGSGIVPPAIQRSYYLLLGILIRPIMIVFGYVAGILIFNALVLYVNLTIAEAVMTVSGEEGLSWMMRAIYTVVYVVVVYALANSCFKLVDIFPNGAMRWIGGAQDQQYDDSSFMQGLVMQMSDKVGKLGTMSNRAHGRRMQNRERAGEAKQPKAGATEGGS